MHAPDETLEFCVLCLLSEGHLIIEDFPGVGKTTLAKALARSVDCSFSRIQFTPDLLPSDVTGVNVFNQRSNEFEFRPGPGVRERAARRRDQPHLAEDPGRAARVRCRSARSRSTASPTRSSRRSWSWRRRTRSSTRAPTRCPRRSSTASRCGSPSAIRRSRTRRRCSRRRPPRRRSTSLECVASAEEVLGAIESAKRLRRGERPPLRGRRAPAHARGHPPLPRRQPARRHRPAPRREGARARRRARLRDPDDVKTVAPTVLAHRLILGAGGARERPLRRGARAGHPRAHVGPRVGPARDFVLTDRGRSLLALGGGVYLVAWAFGSRVLYPLAVGLVLAVVAAALWVRMLRRPMTLRRTLGRGEHLAGDDVPVQLELDAEGLIPSGTLVLRETVARLGERETPLVRKHGRLRGRYVLRRVPRGRYPIEESEVVIEDPFGLERIDGDAAGGRLDPRLPAARRPRQALLRVRCAHARGAPAADAAADRLRSAQRARLPAGRVAAARPLADDGPARPAHGQGARGLAARRDRRAPRR